MLPCLSILLFADPALAMPFQPGSTVTVTADVANTGTGNGTANIKVYLNGAEESSQGVTGSTKVGLDVTRNEPGIYTIYVGGTEAGSFTVDQFADPNVILYISGSLLFFCLHHWGPLYTGEKADIVRQSLAGSQIYL
jgi:hypothetical protein